MCTFSAVREVCWTCGRGRYFVEDHPGIRCGEEVRDWKERMKDKELQTYERLKVKHARHFRE